MFFTYSMLLWALISTDPHKALGLEHRKTWQGHMSGLCLTPTPMLTKLPYSIFTTLTDFINYCWRNSYWTSLTQNWNLLKISTHQKNHTNWFAIRINLCYLAVLTFHIIQEIAPRIDFLSCTAHHTYVHFTQRHGHFAGQTAILNFFRKFDLD